MVRKRGDCQTTATADHCGEVRLISRLETVTSHQLGQPPVADVNLLRALVSLHDGSADHALVALHRWYARRTHAFAVVVNEHLGLGRDIAVLDLREAPIVLERLERDRARLAGTWTRDPKELEALQRVWGVRPS